MLSTLLDFNENLYISNLDKWVWVKKTWISKIFLYKRLGLLNELVFRQCVNHSSHSTTSKSETLVDLRPLGRGKLEWTKIQVGVG